MTTVKDGEIIKTRPKSKTGDYLVCEGKHEAIISEELFNAAQERLGKNHRTPSNKQIRNPFASLLYCKCGKAMIMRFYKKKDGTERCSPRFICTHSYCDVGSCTYDEYLNGVCYILQQKIAEFETKANIDNTDTIKLHANLIKDLEKKLDDLAKKEVSLWDKYAEEEMPQDIFKKLKAKLLKDKSDTQQALKKAYESMPEPVNYEEKVIRLKDALSALKNPKVKPEEKNRLLKDCIERITYSREKPERVRSQQILYYDKEQKKTYKKSPLDVGASWTNPPIELDIKLNI